jgi:hypothetical protein
MQKMGGGILSGVKQHMKATYALHFKLNEISYSEGAFVTKNDERESFRSLCALLRSFGGAAKVRREG